MPLQIATGDLLGQPVEAIVNPWNRNFIPHWLLWPHGVSGAIKKRAGLEPFRELSQIGTLKLGGAVATKAGQLPFRAIIHVACLQWTWTASELSIRLSTRNACSWRARWIWRRSLFRSLAPEPAASGRRNRWAWMCEEIEAAQPSMQIIVVRFGEAS